VLWYVLFLPKFVNPFSAIDLSLYRPLSLLRLRLCELVTFQCLLKPVKDTFTCPWVLLIPLILTSSEFRSSRANWFYPLVASSIPLPAPRVVTITWFSWTWKLTLCYAHMLLGCLSSRFLLIGASSLSLPFNLNLKLIYSDVLYSQTICLWLTKSDFGHTLFAMAPILCAKPINDSGLNLDPIEQLTSNRRKAYALLEEFPFTFQWPRSSLISWSDDYDSYWWFWAYG